ncbi:MAG: rhodanese-like domain-containing protein [Acidiferrobacterales bacterium]
MEFVIHNWYLFLALIVVVYLLASEPAMLKAHNIKLLNVHDTLRLMNDKTTVVVDVREPKEYAEGHMPHTVNIPLGKLAERSGELEKAKEHPVVLVCRSGNRSKKAAVILAKNGFKELYSLNGGVMDWQKDNLPLEK